MMKKNEILLEVVRVIRALKVYVNNILCYVNEVMFDLSCIRCIIPIIISASVVIMMTDIICHYYYLLP